jgi:four helix bundle protein
MATIHSFEDLECWKAATELRREIGKLVKTFPADEKYALTSQTRRASRSVTNNIAEGFGRYHYQEFMRFCRISRGSLNELVDHLIIAHDEEYISTEQLTNLRSKIKKCHAILNGFINYLERAKVNKGVVKEPSESYEIAEKFGITNNE